MVALSAVFLAACSNTAGKGKVEDISERKQLMKPEEFSTAFLNGDFEKVYSQMSKAFRDEVSLKQLKGLAKEFNKDVTAYILQSDLPYGNGAKQYVWTDDSGSKGMLAVFDEDGIVQGLQIMPLTVYPETDNRFTKTIFNLPFKDEWFVVWGGTNSLVNYHYSYDSQRYAYDFVIMNDDRSFEGNPAKNDSYYAFGKEYLAPADGTVVGVENSIEDNEPVGKMNEKQPLGNYVILDHGNGEFSYLAHFKYDSIIVKEGDKVQKGDLLGLVGNSGNSSEPHIHFHVADSPDPLNSKSINIRFDGEKGFVQGDYVE